MGSPTTPMHGKHAALYRRRPNGFVGSGLNDLTFGTGYSGGASAYFEVEIDGEATPDTFRWRKDGGAWTSGVAITGAAQTLSDDQTVTFAATTGHTSGDKWVIGNLAAEATTESGTDAQITDATKRILNPEALPTFTDDGGETVLTVDLVRGLAGFTANVGTVTVAGNDGYIPAAALEKVGYLLGWSLDLSVDLADVSCCGQNWKTAVPGLSGGSGGAEAFLIGSKSFLNELIDAADGTGLYLFLRLFNYDPDADATGDHFDLWATINGLSVAATIGDVVKEPVQFTVHGGVAFTEDA